ncbi:MAG: hypothetical protein LBS48_00710 [Treponema sp.]|jgi:hypothetical protein|nr:hypothetical protein [Treponema sp.]
MTYYIDSQNGNDNADGTNESAPLKTIAGRVFRPGDSVLFKRGSVIRDALKLCDGDETGYITYSAYGQGPNPVINPSVDGGNAAMWAESSPGIWRFRGAVDGDVCGFVFNGGSSFGKLRWSRDRLLSQGEYFFSAYDDDEAKRMPKELYLASAGNPAEVYQSIEILTQKEKGAVMGRRYIIFEHFTVEKTGIHGYTTDFGAHVHIRNCLFQYIGGAMFDLSRKLRYGNAVEFWNGAEDCVVEHCVFRDIYDSAVTHQGEFGKSAVPERFYIRSNVFLRCGLCAYEWRGPSSKDIFVENNVFLEAGGPFTLQGEATRIHELPGVPDDCHDGWFILIWFIESELPPGEIYCTIRNNVFAGVPDTGAAVMSVIGEKYKEQFIIEGNVYRQESGRFATHFYGRTYREDHLAEYVTLTGYDKAGCFLLG